jgi:hypothetical protein
MTDINLRQRAQMNQLNSRYQEKSIQVKFDIERIASQQEEYKEAYLVNFLFNISFYILTIFFY